MGSLGLPRAVNHHCIKTTPRQEGVDEIRIPGERAYRGRAHLVRAGIEIDRRIHDALIALAEGKRGAREAVGCGHRRAPV